MASELAGLPALDRRALVEKWRALYGTEPPSGMGKTFLAHAVAYRLQEKALGGLKPAARRFLENADSASKHLVLSVCPKPGTRLLREWHGETYEVSVLEDGIYFEGRPYRSLSEVARAITGTRWSGPRFFGLKKQEA